MAGKIKRPPIAPDTTRAPTHSGDGDTPGLCRRCPYRPSKRAKFLALLQHFDDGEPQTQLAIRLWSEGRPIAEIEETTGLRRCELRAIWTSPAALTYYREWRQRVDAARIELAAITPWLKLAERIYSSQD